MDYDFGGWATRNDTKCSDGRVIRRDAFKHCDGKTVPVVWNHQHDSPANVVGHAVLHNRKEGVYAYGTFNDTEAGSIAKALVQHSDIRALSIYANRLKQNGDNVMHGNIVELSLVLAGANPGAYIEDIIQHGEGQDGESIISFVMNDGLDLDLTHADESDKTESNLDDTSSSEDDSESKKEETVEDIWNTLTDRQKASVYTLIGTAVAQHSDEVEENNKEGGSEGMLKSLFENNEGQTSDIGAEAQGRTLSHSEIRAIFDDVKRYGSLRDSVMAHAQTYGIENIDYLFPEAKTLTNTPEFLSREMGWVQKVMSGVHHTPFSRIKSVFADITEDDARARGYIKGKLKKEEVFGLLKRTTTPTTVYKKQKLDRDDIIDITDFDVVVWLKGEMRLMLDEELARAFLIGDGRLASSDDHINDQNIRPISTDADLYTIKVGVNIASTATEDERAKAFIRSTIKNRKSYKGSGQPTLFTTEDMLTDMLLLEDGIGHSLYADEAALARKLRVKEIVTVPVMENQKGPNGGELLGIVVNLADYNVGADRGGAVSMFDDFDIDYNQQKYLIETRCSGALIKPYSAMVMEVGTKTSTDTTE